MFFALHGRAVVFAILLLMFCSSDSPTRMCVVVRYLTTCKMNNGMNINSDAHVLLE